jgi:hypothetical protein
MKRIRSLAQIIVLALVSLDCAAAATGSNDAPTPSSGDWTRVNDNDFAVTYSANVQSGPDSGYYDQDLHCSAVMGEWCKFSFTGKGVKWIGGKNNDHGKADVYLDGKLDATVDTSSPSWRRQQELYVKTGLADGPHVLMVQIKTAGFQDFDAFEYLGVPVPVAPIKIGQATLPAQVPYLNPPHRYAIGSGVAMAVINVGSDMSQLAGPGYTNPNLIDSEQLTLEIDGDVQPLHLEMKRAAQTGIYYGVATRGDLQIVLVDYTCSGQPWLARLLVVNNLSATEVHAVRVRDEIKPSMAVGMSHGLIHEDNPNCRGIFFGATTSAAGLFGDKPNPAKGSVVAAFTDPATTAFHTGPIYVLEASLNNVAPHGSYQETLCHYFHRANMTNRQCLDTVRAFDSGPALKKSIQEWQEWFAHVPPSYQLSQIKDERARTLVEGGLSVIKTNQSLDGGFVANISFFRQGFYRDTVLGLRAMSATGHFDELKLWLLWSNHVFEHFAHIPDCASCMPTLAEDQQDWDMGNTGVEGPGHVLLCARDYLAATHDFATLRGVDKMLRFCMEEQLRQAVANGEKLEFNGDETEVCGAVDITSAGTEMRIPAQVKDWSLSSVAICAASLDFFIKYVAQCGENPDAYHSQLTGTTLNLHDELAKLVAAMDRDFWRTDVAGLPDGFHDAFRLKADGAWPKQRVSNICLMPVYFSTPYADEKKAKDVAAIASYFNAKTGFLQLAPGGDTGFDGHDLGYLLWGLIEIGDARKDAVYKALVDGPTCDAWGAFNEAYDGNGAPNDHNLRTMETGVNISAIANYWNLGASEKHP